MYPNSSAASATNVAVHHCPAAASVVLLVDEFGAVLVDEFGVELTDG